MIIAVLESLSEDLERLVDDRMTSGAKEPRLVGDVLIMPNNAFAAIQAGFPTNQAPFLSHSTTRELGRKRLMMRRPRRKG